MMGLAGDPSFLLILGLCQEIMVLSLKNSVGLNFHCHHQKHLLAIYLQEYCIKWVKEVWPLLSKILF